jgi:hypothetical protein
VFQGSGSLPPLTIDEERFTTRATSRVDVTVDWTFPASVIGVYVVQGGCTLDQDESLSAQVVQSSVGCPALTSATATHDASQSDMRRMSRDFLHR